MLKTLDEFLADPTVNLYPSDVDQATKDLVQLWFGYRRVANNRMFPQWFYRIMNRDYPRYQEILRIEARTAGSEYDWLVTNYEERQVENQLTDTSSENKTKNTSRTNNRTFTAGTSEVTVDSNTQTGTGTVTNAQTGTDTNLMTRNLASSDNESGSRNMDIDDTVTRTPNLSSVNKNSTTDSSRHGVLHREAPYSADYAGLTPSLNDDVAHGVNEDGVDNGTPELLNNSKFNAGFPALVISNPTSAEDEITNNAGVTYTENAETGNEITARITDHDETSSLTKSGTQTGTENNARTLNLTDTETRNTTDQQTGRSETTRSGSDRDNETVTGSDTSTGTVQATKNGVERTIFTGRSGQSPQFLLDEAVKFIQNTSAWKWLYRQLDTCFMLLYDLDEYEED